MSTPAAISVHNTELLVFFTLLQLTIIVLAGRLGGEAARRFAQSAAVGEIIVGILLGPSLFGIVAPDVFHFVFRSVPSEPMQVLSQIGLILLMFQIGLEFNFSHLTQQRHRKTVVRVATASLLLPFVIGLVFGYYSAPILSPQADQVAAALFIATAFSITALPILGRILIEFNLANTSLGVIAISAAAINDVIGWLLLALITTIATANFDGGEFSLRVFAVALFFATSWFVIRPIMKKIVRHFDPRDGKLSNNLLGILIAAVFMSGMTTYQLGIFAIFGGFMMGVILHDEHELVTAWRERVGHFVNVFFLPIFFTNASVSMSTGKLSRKCSACFRPTFSGISATAVSFFSLL